MKVNQLKVGAALSYMSLGLGNIISIIYTPIMLRLLGQSEYGLYNLVASVVSYLGLFNFGFGSTYIRYYSKFKVKNQRTEIARLNGMFLIVFSILGIITVLAGIVLVLNTNTLFGSKLTPQELKTSKVLMLILVFNMGITFPTMIFNSYITSNEQFVFQKFIQMIKTVANPFLVLPVLVLGYGSIGMVIITTILNILIEFANVIFCFRKLKIEFSFKQINLNLLKDITVFSSYIFLGMIIDQINWNVGKFIVGRFHGTVGVATYGLAAQLNTYYLSLSTAISNVFIPRVNKIVAVSNNNNELTLLFTRVGRLQFILLSLVAMGLVFFGLPFINIWAGSSYSDSYLIVLFLILPVTVPLIQNIGIEIQRAKNMHKFRSWVYLIIAIINIAISIPLTKAFGGAGAASGTAMALLFGHGFIMNWYYHAKIQLDMRYFWIQIIKFIPALIPPMLFGSLINLHTNLYNIMTLVACGTLFIVIYLISMWFLGMNQYEKSLIKQPISRVIKSTSLKIKLKF